MLTASHGLCCGVQCELTHASSQPDLRTGRSYVSFAFACTLQPTVWGWCRLHFSYLCAAYVTPPRASESPLIRFSQSSFSKPLVSTAYSVTLFCVPVSAFIRLSGGIQFNVLYITDIVAGFCRRCPYHIHIFFRTSFAQSTRIQRMIMGVSCSSV